MVTWGFPVEDYRGLKPTRSQEYHLPAHEGVDIMFRRNGRDDVGIAGSPNYFMPDGVHACAAADGQVVRAYKMSNGWACVIDHGESLFSLYLHMSELVIPEVRSRSPRVMVKRGDRLGVIGASPLDAEHLKHLHFEIWTADDPTKHVDPWPLIAGKPVPLSRTLQLMLLSLLAAAGVTLGRWFT